MGIFNMYVAPNESYYAKAISAAGVERIVALPTVEDVGAVIDAMLFSNRLVYRVRSSSDEIIEGAHIVINAHGRIAACSEVHPNHTSVLASDQLLEGINIISLISASGEVLSERLIFKYPTSMGELSMSCDRENYGRRERVGVTLSLHDSFGEAAAGEFGISVTDDSSVHFDRGAENIVSYLTLSSDIYGYIEEPGLYFVEDDPLASKKIDLLMRTQGWRRFDVEQILAETTPAPTIPYESMVEIKGSVKGFFGNAARNPVIHVLNADLNYFDSFKLDNSNLFKLQGLDLPDSTIYVIQAKGRKGGNSLTLLIEPERFPAPKANMGSIRRKSSYVPQAFINQSQDKFFYEGGMNLIDIDAVYVSVDKSPKSSSGVDSSRSTGREELDLMSGLSLPMILQRYPSISISEEGVTYRSNNSMARFILDGFDVEYDFISTMTSDEIERIDFYEGAAAVMYSDAAGGVFVLESRSGVGSFSSATEPLSMAKVAHLGYQRHATHYQPRYDNPSLRRDLPPDHRTTLFWSGELCPNTQGEINFEFFTADKATHYTVWVEGITEQGELLRKSFSIERTADR